MTVADGDDAELLQILSRQPGQDVEIDPVVPKGPFVFPEAESAQPVADVHWIFGPKAARKVFDFVGAGLSERFGSRAR